MIRQKLLSIVFVAMLIALVGVIKLTPNTSSLKGQTSFIMLVDEPYSGQCGSYDACSEYCECTPTQIDMGDGMFFYDESCTIKPLPKSYRESDCNLTPDPCATVMMSGYAGDGRAQCICENFYAPENCPTSKTNSCDGVNCDDGDVCTTDSCSAGVCNHVTKSCNDNNACTTDSCNATTGACENTAKDCNDNNACTTDSCNASTGACENKAKSCDDSNACTTDSCDSATGTCTNKTKVCPDDGDYCTTDVCDASTGQCVHNPPACSGQPNCTVMVDICHTDMCWMTAIDCGTPTSSQASSNPKSSQISTAYYSNTSTAPNSVSSPPQVPSSPQSSAISSASGAVVSSVSSTVLSPASSQPSSDSSECLTLADCPTPQDGCHYDITANVEECSCPPVVCASSSVQSSANHSFACTNSGVCDILIHYCCKEYSGTHCEGEPVNLSQTNPDCFDTQSECLNMCSKKSSASAASSQVASAVHSAVQNSVGGTTTGGGDTGTTGGGGDVGTSGGTTGGTTGGTSDHTPFSDSAICGDHQINQPFEECDDGNFTDFDGCSSVCKVQYANSQTANAKPTVNTRSVTPPICGDGQLQSGEQCDDGNRNSNDGCSAQCFLESGTDAYCGDAILTIGESCDYGDLNADKPNFCRTDCTSPICGDGIIDDRSGEECDDGKNNSTAPDACRPNCLLPYCGDGTKDSGEECDDGNTIDNDDCSSLCKDKTPTLVATSSLCGNGQTEVGEECDDGNRLPGDGCSVTCKIEAWDTLSPVVQQNLVAALPLCGNGLIEGAEQCDDGNRKDHDGCNRYCETEQQPVRPSAPEQQPENPTLVAGESMMSTITLRLPDGTTVQVPKLAQQNIGFPTQQTPSYQLPLAQLQPLIQSQGPIGQTGPAAVVVIGAGAAAGMSWIRRKRKR